MNTIVHIPIQWLLENHPKNNSALLWETMELMIEGNVAVRHLFQLIRSHLKYEGQGV